MKTIENLQSVAPVLDAALLLTSCGFFPDKKPSIKAAPDAANAVEKSVVAKEGTVHLL